MRPLTIGLVGNPNSGKSTLFNRLTGLNQRVGNWAGVTVERREGKFCTHNHRTTLVDLPGIYSLTTPSEQAALDEQIACRYICSREADLFINVIDAANLARDLYLTVQLLEMGIPCIIALNRVDSVQQQGISMGAARLSAKLTVPVVPLSSIHGKGLKQLCAAIDRYSLQASTLRIAYPVVVEMQVTRIASYIMQQSPPRRYWLALQLLEGDFASGVDHPAAAAILDDAKQKVQQESGEDAALLIADARYRFIATVYQDVNQSQQREPTTTGRIDRIVLNRWLGIPVFMLLMYLIFFVSINLGGALQPLFNHGSYAIFVQGTQWLGNQVGLPDWLSLLLAQGIGGGINTIMPVIPQVSLMFLLLTLLEDSGYMARAAFVMDRLMQALGLPGKSFVPLIIGFGCNVPSIMGTRTLDSERERLLTIMMAPFMACSARLAIFVVFSATFFASHGAMLVFSLYLLGMIVAVLTGILLKSTLIRGDSLPFIMELPTYHRPHFRTLGAQIWQRLKGFVLRAGKTIILVNLLIGGLNSLVITGKAAGHNTHDSALSTVGRWVTPMLKPMGVFEENWPATVGLITGAIAKEVVLGTLNTLYITEQLTRERDLGDMADRDNIAHFNLLQELKSALQQTRQGLIETFSLDAFANPVKASSAGNGMSSSAMGAMADKFRTPMAAYSYLIFVLLYIPCAATVGAIGRESGRGWMWFSVLWGLDVAYSLATLYYQSATFNQHPSQSSFIIAIVIVVNLVVFTTMRRIQRNRLSHYAIGKRHQQPLTRGGIP